jgi:two-component sensor histidine kinase
MSLRAGPSGAVVLTVADDGRTEENQSIGSSNSVGSRITRALVEQLEGEIEVVQDHGTTVIVTVPRPDA